MRKPFIRPTGGETEQEKTIEAVSLIELYNVI